MEYGNQEDITDFHLLSENSYLISCVYRVLCFFLNVNFHFLGCRRCSRQKVFQFEEVTESRINEVILKMF